MSRINVLVAPADGDTLAVGRERGVRVVRGLAQRPEPATRAVEPDELALREGGARPVGEHSASGNGEGVPDGRERGDPFGHGRGVAGEAASLRVERLRHQRAAANVEQMTRRRVDSG
jgi:hypothetical protein